MERVRILNVVTPLTAASKAPVNETVLLPEVNVPLLVKLPERRCVEEPAANVAPLPMVRSPLTVMAPDAVFVPPVENVIWWNVAEGIDCAPLALKSTVLGVVDVTLNVPAVMVNTPAIPRYEPEPSCSDVPFNVTLNRFAVPANVEVPVNVVVPEVDVSEPEIEIFDAIEKSRATEIVPEIDNA